MNRTTIYCIKPYSGTTSAPIWSPNKDQFLVEAENPQNRDRRVLMLIDVEKNLAVMLSEGKIPYGWMVVP